jgi:hypothetical protein
MIGKERPLKDLELTALKIEELLMDDHSVKENAREARSNIIDWPFFSLLRD